MLRNVLGDYLDNVKERQLDLPLLLLLPAMGFYDVHLTHGSVEFGKDLIAKRREDGIEVQYSFQSKVGDIKQAEWRNVIFGQMHESVFVSLSHPNFDTALPHQSVLLTTGDLKGQAAVGFQDLNKNFQESYGKRPIIFWSRQNLIDLFIDYGLSGMLRTTASGFEEYGRFLLLYSRALEGAISDREIESYSRHWLEPSTELDRRLLQCAIEAEVLSQQCLARGLVYEAVHTKLALLRVLYATSYTDDGDRLGEPYERAIATVHDLCATHLTAIRKPWYTEHSLLRIAPLSMTTYLVLCARIMELASLAYITTTDEGLRAEFAEFLEEFIRNEPGCCHPLSDRYAVSLVTAVLVLCDARRQDVACDLVHQGTIWLCDRYEQGMGLSGFEADEMAETQTLLGYAFDFIDLPRPAGSFLATTLGDLAAFLGDHRLYGDIVNDIKACDIHMEYWQPQDTVGACSVESADVLHYSSVTFDDNPSDFSDYQFADHVRHEYAMFRFVDTFGPEAGVVLMILLRDRYFPKLWPLLAPNRGQVTQRAS